jgi:hypothetical protein
MIEPAKSKEAKFARRWLLLLIPLAVAIPCWTIPYFYHNYIGYCSEKDRILSDQEKIAAVVEFIISMRLPVNMPPPAKVGRNEITYDVIYYSSVAEFLLVNPDCCHVTKEIYIEGAPMKLSFEDRICGRVADYVSVRYLIRYRDAEGAVRSQSAQTSYPISPCGNIVDLF